ncbi:MAG: DUF5119 domain-containing protein, partial [Muribaculaceae bacterium]|nr:DUF5119 domain-containing protein [Muribaculaceae bacterium]
MKLSRIKFIASILLLMSTMMSCRDELCYNHFRNVALTLTYEQEWERDYGMHHSSNWDASLYGFEYDNLRPDLPEWVSLTRFSADGLHSETFLESMGGNVNVDKGEGQSFLIYNGDTDYIIFSDISMPPNARAEATGRSRSSLDYVTGIHPGARTTNPPDLLYSAYVTDVPAVEKHESKPMSVKMQPLVYTYVIRYEFEYGFNHVALARGALGGMAESVYLIDGRTSDESAIVLFDCDLKEYGCEANVRTFGVPGFPDEYYGKPVREADNNSYTLNLEVRLKNGNYVEYNFDISEQIANQPRGGVIKVSGLRVEDEISSTNAGFNVEVDGWGERVDIDLPVT